ncbi:DUF6503 family protein [Salinimicrobium soli]|uniref:DUF6503 family protein n=1 Tax=Salinimicrobium soli TaxID=1254399 RepID=UPI003AACA272
MKKYLLLLITVLFISCGDSSEENPADVIVSKAIEKAGGDLYEKAEIRFNFRDRKYRSKRNNGLFELVRYTYNDSLGAVQDVLTNEGFTRLVNNEEVELPDTLATSIAESVNSVHYFVQLPYGLNADAVKKKLIGEDTINGKTYYEIEVTFKQDGGGADHEDVYMYWIEKGDYTVDFMAYRFFVDDGGIRFRVAGNPRVINGIRFVDYENYKTNDLSTPLEELDELYTSGKLIKVSEIKNKNLKVDIN